MYLGNVLAWLRALERMLKISFDFLKLTTAKAQRGVNCSVCKQNLKEK